LNVNVRNEHGAWHAIDKAKVTAEEGQWRGICPFLNFPPENASNLVSPKNWVNVSPVFRELGKLACAMRGLPSSRKHLSQTFAAEGMTTGQGSRERETEEGQNKKTDKERTSPRRNRSRQAQALPAFDFHGVSNTRSLVGVNLNFTQRWNALMLRGQLPPGQNEAPVLSRVTTEGCSSRPTMVIPSVTVSSRLINPPQTPPRIER
jgi:hypothetical protein